MKTKIIREVSKKEKIYGITIWSWRLSFMTPFIFIPTLGLFISIGMGLFIFALLFLLETFYDEDLIDFLVAKAKNKNIPDEFYG